MPHYGILREYRFEDIDDVLGAEWPGEMKPMKNPLGTTQVALTYRRLPQHAGSKGSYGHRHENQEEIIFVISGQVQVKAGDDVVEVPAQSAIRIAPGTTQGIWNDRPQDAEVLLISNRMDNPPDIVTKDPDFWPAG